MRKSLVSKIISLLLVVAVITLSDIQTVKAATIWDLTGDTYKVESQDPLRLINLAMLNKVDIEALSYNDITILDTLTDRELNMFNFSSSTIALYQEQLNNACTALKNGMNYKEITKYADEAYRLYMEKIAIPNADKFDAADIENTIIDYVTNYADSSIDIGNIDERLPEIFSEYILAEVHIVENDEKFKIKPSFTIVDMNHSNYECTKTVWYTGFLPLKAIVNGKIIELTDTKLTTSVGTINNELVVSYKCKNPAILINENAKVGATLSQGDNIFDSYNNTFEIEMTYNGKNIDLLSLLGVSGKLLLNEYKRSRSEPYDKIREDYINTFLSQHINN